MCMLCTMGWPDAGLDPVFPPRSLFVAADCQCSALRTSAHIRSSIVQASDYVELLVSCTLSSTARRLLTFARSVDTLIGALSKRPEVKNLTCVSNNAGVGKLGLGGSLVRALAVLRVDRRRPRLKELLADRCAHL